MQLNLKRLSFEKSTLRALTDVDMRDVVGASGICSCVASTASTCDTVTQPVCKQKPQVSETCYPTVLDVCCFLGD